MSEGEGSTYRLSEKDQAMLNRHARDLEERAERSRDWDERSSAPKEWIVDLPKRAEHPYAGIGKPSDVKKGDKARMTGEASRHDTHPHGKEEVVLDRRTT